MANPKWYSKATMDLLLTGGPKVLAGTGIDPTGATVSTAGVQAFLNSCVDGDTVIVPSHAVINLNGTLTINHRITLTGSGELRWTAGLGGGGASDVSMIIVRADGCVFDGLYLTNPSRAFSNTGGKSVGINVYGSRVRIQGCTIVGQQNAILVGADGEWHDIVIIGNFILDVPGGGAEDRGDGIGVMGAAATIVGNRVTAYESSTNDPRIGIALEGLPVYEATPYTYGDSMCVIANNVVTGPWRRSITSEGTASCSILGNVVSGWTIWGMNIVNKASHNIMADNVITSLYAAGDTRGNDVAPIRAGIMIYDDVYDADVHDNIIRVMGTGVVTGIAVVNGNAPSQDVNIHNNTIDGMLSQHMDYGVLIPNGSNTTRIDHNTIKNFANTGVQAVGAKGVEITRNIIQGHGTGTKGAHTEGAGTDGRFDFNTIDNVGSAIEAYFRTGSVSLMGNRISNATTGIDLFGTTATATLITVAINLFNGVTNKIANAPSSGVTNIGNN